MKKNDRILEEFVKSTRKRLGRHVRNIILFGSRARGDDEPDSDYDFLLVLDRISSALINRVDELAADFLYEYNVVFSVFPVSEANYKKQKFNPLFLNIRHDGITL